MSRVLCKAPRPAAAEVLCPRRAQRRQFSSSPKQATQGATTTSPSSGKCKLANRRLIILHGHDASHFLQGLTTQNIHPQETRGHYSAFLNAQGRVLQDVFIYPAAHSQKYKDTLLAAKEDPGDPGYLIEVDEQQATTLLKHLKKHRLRSKVNVRLVEEGEWHAWSTWREEDRWTAHSSFGTEDGTIGCIDARAPGMGQRLVLPQDTQPGDETTEEEVVPLESYRLRRILKGVPEGQSEILPESALPQESNIDFMGGVDFRKGCYVGQELTIRTHHTGVVRKRILPMQLYNTDDIPQELSYDGPSSLAEQATPGDNIARVNARGRSTGKWLAGVGNVGLGLCRLEMMTDLVLTREGTQYSPEQEFRLATTPDGKEEVKVRPFVPDWIRSRISQQEPPRTSSGGGGSGGGGDGGT